MAQWYQRKPVKVCATQWQPELYPRYISEDTDHTGSSVYYLHSHRGRMPIVPGDWILESGKYIWVVEQEAFEQLYEPARSDESQDITTHSADQAHQQASQILDELLSQNKRELRSLEQLVPLIGTLGAILKMEQQVDQLGHLGNPLFQTKKERWLFLGSLWDDIRARIETIWEDETARAEREGHE